MIEEKNLNQVKKSIVVTAKSIMDGTTDPIEGCRSIVAKKHHFYDQGPFLPFVAVDSETDHFPLGEIRSKYSDEYLRRIDKERDHYLDSMSTHIYEACLNLVSVFS